MELCGQCCPPRAGRQDLKACLVAVAVAGGRSRRTREAGVLRSQFVRDSTAAQRCPRLHLQLLGLLLGLRCRVCELSTECEHGQSSLEKGKQKSLKSS